MKANIETLIRRYMGTVGMNADEYLKMLGELEEDHAVQVQVYGPEHNWDAEPRAVLDLEHLELTNVKATAWNALDFAPGLTLIAGSNDSGKTTLQEALHLLLGGRGSTGRPVDAITKGQDHLTVSAKFGGGIGITRGVKQRQITRGKRAGETEVDYSLTWEQGEASATKSEAEANLKLYLGVPWDFLKRTCMVTQGDLTQILDEQPAQRRDLFFKMLAISCELTRTGVAKVLTAETDAIGRHTATKLELTQKVNVLISQLATHQGRDKLAGELEQLTKAAAKEEAGGGNRRDLEQQIVLMRHYRAQHAQLTQEHDRLAPIAGLSGYPKPDLAREEAIQSQMRDRNGLINEATRSLKTINERAAKLKAAPDVCPTCLEYGATCNLGVRGVRDEKLGELRVQWYRLNEEGQTLVALNEQHGEELAVLQTQIVEWQERDQLIADARKALVEVDRQHASLQTGMGASQEQVETQLAQLEAQLAAMPTVEAEGVAAAYQKEITRVKGLLETVTQLNARLDAYRKQLADLPDPADNAPRRLMLERLVEVFGKTGLPLWLAGEHVAEVNAIARQVMSGDAYVYQFDGDLAVVTEYLRSGTPGRNQIKHELASGSSRQRGALVLLAALGHYVQRLTGLSIPLFWVDELPFQDADATPHIVEILRAVQRLFPKTIFAASDWARFKRLDFDTVIQLGPDGFEKAAGALVTEAATQPPQPGPVDEAADAFREQGKLSVTQKESDEFWGGKGRLVAHNLGEDF